MDEKYGLRSINVALKSIYLTGYSPRIVIKNDKIYFDAALPAMATFIKTLFDGVNEESGKVAKSLYDQFTAVVVSTVNNNGRRPLGRFLLQMQDVLDAYRGDRDAASMRNIANDMTRLMHTVISFPILVEIRELVDDPDNCLLLIDDGGAK